MYGSLGRIELGGSLGALGTAEGDAALTLDLARPVAAKNADGTTRAPRSGILAGVRASQLTSALFSNAGFAHAFFTRKGGVSKPPFDTLNFAYSTGDERASVEENVARAGAVLGVDPSRIYYLHQVHGVGVQVLDGSAAREAVRRLSGDVTASSTAGVACGVQTADCVPVLLADRESGAVAAVHSGWKGTVANAARAGVAALRALTGREGSLVAAVGPHIEPCCFEVGHDVAEQLAACSLAGGDVIDVSRNKPHVDLRRIVEAQLREAGVREVDHVRGCTHCDAERFHSYRRDGKVGGRMLAAVVARENASEPRIERICQPISDSRD